MELPETLTMRLEDIKPYENNPRRITPEAVAAVKQSIERYGYVQPIAVHKGTNEIVVGHTRYAALKELGVEEIGVYVLDITEEKAREYRLIDNKTSELSEWDHNSLVMELREWDQQLLESYFPDVDLEIGQLRDMEVTQDDVDEAVKSVSKIREAPPQPLVEVVCPSCFHTFKVKAASLPGLSHSDIDVLTSRARE